MIWIYNYMKGEYILWENAFVLNIPLHEKRIHFITNAFVFTVSFLIGVVDGKKKIWCTGTGTDMRQSTSTCLFCAWSDARHLLKICCLDLRFYVLSASLDVFSCLQLGISTHNHGKPNHGECNSWQTDFGKKRKCARC